LSGLPGVLLVLVGEILGFFLTSASRLPPQPLAVFSAAARYPAHALSMLKNSWRRLSSPVYPVFSAGPLAGTSFSRFSGFILGIGCSFPQKNSWFLLSPDVWWHAFHVGLAHRVRATARRFNARSPRAATQGIFHNPLDDDRVCASSWRSPTPSALRRRSLPASGADGLSVPASRGRSLGWFARAEASRSYSHGVLLIGAVNWTLPDAGELFLMLPFIAVTISRRPSL